METDAMGFRETLRYGINHHWHSCQIKTRERKELKRKLRGHYPDILIPSALAPDPNITPELVHATESIYHLIARAENRPYDEAIVAEADAEKMARERFLASGWSRLFPSLTRPPETITLRV